MKTKLFIIIFAVVISGILAVVLSRRVFQKSQPSAKIDTSTTTSAQSISSQSVQEYIDPAGFKFSYPSSITVSSRDITDDAVYSSLEATSSSTLGKITIEAISSDLLTLDDMLSSKIGVVDVKLADLNAKQYTEKGAIITLALDKGALFTITVTSGGNVNYWNEVNSKIVSTFAFAPPETVQEGSNSSSTDSDITFEGEETIE
ncbi:MAG: hypothetical protein V1922_04345 [bacterium]